MWQKCMLSSSTSGSVWAQAWTGLPETTREALRWAVGTHILGPYLSCSPTRNCINSFSASVTQRKEHQELPDESAELIRKKSNESFPETKSQKDRDNPSPHAMP